MYLKVAKLLLITLITSFINSCNSNVNSSHSEVDHQMLREKVEVGIGEALYIKGQAGKVYSIQERMKYYNVPGISIAVVDNGQIVWAKAYGVKELGSNNLVTESTLFQAASVSKPIAALGALLLVQDGYIDLDTNINNYLKSWQIPENSFTTEEKVNLRRILSHSAGLSVHGFVGYPYGRVLPTTVQILNGVNPANSEPVVVKALPGSVSEYSGGGTTVMQLLIEDITRKPFASYMQDAILNPLAMHNSTYQQPLPIILHTKAASGHIYDKDKHVKVIEGKFHTYPEMAAAGLWTTPNDLARAIIAIQARYNGDDSMLRLTTKVLKEMLTLQNKPFGLGPMIHQESGVLVFEHSGVNEGFTTDWYGFMPLNKVDNSFQAKSQSGGVVIMANAEPEIAYYLIREIFASITEVYNWPQIKTKE